MQVEYDSCSQHVSLWNKCSDCNVLMKLVTEFTPSIFECMFYYATPYTTITISLALTMLWICSVLIIKFHVSPNIYMKKIRDAFLHSLENISVFGTEHHWLFPLIFDNVLLPFALLTLYAGDLVSMCCKWRSARDQALY